jgi:hypothetical protein
VAADPLVVCPSIHNQITSSATGAIISITGGNISDAGSDTSVAGSNTSGAVHPPFFNP